MQAASLTAARHHCRRGSRPTTWGRTCVWAVLITLAIGAIASRSAVAAPAVTIPVILLVDEEEVAVDHVWKERLGQRLAKASAIVSQYCEVHFAILRYGRWQSDDRISDLSKSLREFEQEVRPPAGSLAIGFSSQYRFQKGMNGLGGTRGPLHTHILLRESARTVYEPERLEALVHELGHYLGAAHSGRADSAMRPVIGDGRARAKDYQIRFDPENARIIRLVANEMNYLNVRRFSQLSPATRTRLGTEYVQLARQLPGDPAATRFLKMVQAGQSASANNGGNR